MGYSSGNYCSNSGHPFLWEGDEYPEECAARCTTTPACMFFTAFVENVWCQINSRCEEESKAGDGSSHTFSKVLPRVVCSANSPSLSCYEKRETQPSDFVDESFRHWKPLTHRNTMMKHGGKIGIPLKFGWNVARLSELGSDIRYTEHSRGNYCSNGGYPFVFEGTESYAEECIDRCTSTPACMFFTVFLEHGWCQINSRCEEEQPAGDASAITFMKRFPKQFVRQ